MKKALLLSVSLVLLSAGAAMAETAIGVVNVAKIMQDSKAANSVRSQLQAKQKSFQSELDAKEKTLLAEDKALADQKDKVEKTAFEKKVKDFRERAAATQREVQNKRQQLDKAFSTSLEEIQKNVIDITKQIAAEKKLNLVVSSSQVLYNDPALDITADVLKSLDSKLPTLSVKF